MFLIICATMNFCANKSMVLISLHQAHHTIFWPARGPTTHCWHYIVPFWPGVQDFGNFCPPRRPKKKNSSNSWQILKWSVFSFSHGMCLNTQLNWYSNNLNIYLGQWLLCVPYRSYEIRNLCWKYFLWHRWPQYAFMLLTRVCGAGTKMSCRFQVPWLAESDGSTSGIQ
jgi:hypothetical protein